MAKNKAVVKVLGREYTLVSPETVEHMESIADCVNNKLNELSFSGRYLSQERLMTLTALNLADELLKSQAEIETLKCALEWKKLQDKP